jgi:hypothetical protein
MNTLLKDSQQRRVELAAGNAHAKPGINEQRLECWLLENGGHVSGVTLCHRQVKATELLVPGRCLVSVPRACQVRYDDVHDEAMQALFSRVPRGSSSESDGAWQFKQALTVRSMLCFCTPAKNL